MDNTISPRQGFIGKDISTRLNNRDSESDLADHGVRKYEYITCRFMAVDPLWEQYYAYTPYNYCGNNPILLKDPTGKEWYQEAEEYKEEVTYTDNEGKVKTKVVTKTRMVWKWYENTSEKDVWQGEYDKDGNKVFVNVKGESDAELYLDILIDQATEQFGIKDIVALASVLSGLNVLPSRAKLGGATKGTSVASKYLSELLPCEMPI